MSYLPRPADPGDAARRRQPGSALWWALALPLVAFLALPLLALLAYGSPGDIAANLRNPAVRQAISLSLRSSGWATLASVILGTPVAFLLARRQFRGRALLDVLIDLPIVLPPAVAGLALLLVFGRAGWLGQPLAAAGLRITFTELAVVMAQTFIAVSFYVRSAAIGFAAVEPELEDAAAIDGANRWQVFWRMTVPLSRWALLTGIVLAWARAMGEFGATIIFAGNLPGRTQTMPLAIYLGFEMNLSLAVTLSVILVGFAFLALLLVKLLYARVSDEP